MRAINAINRAGGIRAGRRQRRADQRRDGRVRPRRRRLRPRRQRPRRWPAAGHPDRPGRGAGSLRGGARGCRHRLVLSTMLHGIGVGNMLPAWVPVVCVDINPGGRHQARRPRIVADDRHRDRRRVVPAPAGGPARTTRTLSTRNTGRGKTRNSRGSRGPRNTRNTRITGRGRRGTRGTRAAEYAEHADHGPRNTRNPRKTRITGAEYGTRNTPITRINVLRPATNTQFAILYSFDSVRM